MPVIPTDTSDFPSVQGSNDTQNNDSPKGDHEQKKATASDFLSKGPQIPDSMPPKASKEEIEQRMKDLNK